MKVREKYIYIYIRKCSAQQHLCTTVCMRLRTSDCMSISVCACVCVYMEASVLISKSLKRPEIREFRTERECVRERLLDVFVCKKEDDAQERKRKEDLCVCIYTGGVCTHEEWERERHSLLPSSVGQLRAAGFFAGREVRLRNFDSEKEEWVGTWILVEE